MNEPPGTIPKAIRSHPRRPPAHKSVSLRHSPPPPSVLGFQAKEQPTTRSSPTLASDKANPPSSVSPQLHSNKNSSGESSDAGQWFEKTNNRASQSKASFVDSNLGKLGTDGSSTEDFRSVIDDLTVANKRLKQKLKKYEKLYDAHLQEEKLFEVRFHGLPDHKKKELEETLRKFASELDDGTANDYAHISAAYTPALETHNTASSTSRFAESGYASMSASGQNSAGPSNQEKDRKITRSAYSRQQQNIQSYLHDIPMGLLPNNKSVLMTEKSKKKMVVRRLEQIFAGKRSLPGSHPQPLQQQEVAQSAATADREQREATGQSFRPEGQREARIMLDRGAVDEDDTGQNEAIQGLRPSLHVEEHDFAGSGLSPDQRPTRPLDLDPHRAQVPNDNMSYIRHLGFTPPDMNSGEAPLGHGWIYLNLLINMAQLHTLNVTPEFVKDALHEYSSHLEISRDGRKIRWKGGRDITQHSSESSSEHYSGASPNETGSLSPFKRMKTGTSGDSSDLTGSERARRLARVQREREQNKFAYKPLFFHKEESENEDDFYGFDADSLVDYPYQHQPAGNSSGFSSSIMQSSSSKPQRRDDGPMIFYNKAKFCTDLSGDRNGASLTMPGNYKPITSQPLGAKSGLQSQTSTAADLAEPRGPFENSPSELDSNSGSRAISSVDDLGFSPEALRDDSGNTSPEVMDFEASGVGGVQPEDNFSIHVRRSQVPTAPLHAATDHALSSNQEELETSSPRSSPSRVIQEKILSASRKDLPNSTLPPASFLPFDSCSSGDVDSDLESDASSEPDTDSDCPATAMQILNIAPVGSNDPEASESKSDYEDSDDGSVDLLATARQQDPSAVRASEREYDAALADRLAEEIPAGSSAATAGGGSGFNSPAGGAHQAAKLEKRLSRQSVSSSMASGPANLKRSRTSDSMNPQPTKSPKTRRSGALWAVLCRWSWLRSRAYSKRTYTLPFPKRYFRETSIRRRSLVHDQHNLRPETSVWNTAISCYRSVMARRVKLAPTSLEQRRSITMEQLNEGRDRSGWAGFTVARTLDPSKYQTVVVSPRSYFAFTPLLASTAVGTLEFRTALEPVRSRRTKVEFFQGWADDVDFKNRSITIEEAVDDPRQGVALTTDRHAGKTDEERAMEKKQESKEGKLFHVDYDKLIVTVGCYSQTFGTPGVKEHAFFLKDVGDARRIRNRILACFEGAALPTTPVDMKRQLLNFAVVGGGPTGIEFSAELHDLINEDMRKLYPELIKYHKITVYDVAEKVLPMFDKKLAGYAMQKFKREGIDIKTSHHVEELRPGAPVETSTGNVDESHLYTLKIKELGEIGVGMCVWSKLKPFALPHKTT
ncbi:frequency clock protein [Stemphylium lycopersici]|nr:frequency clock protein [Stemphylium lycopersici]